MGKIIARKVNESYFHLSANDGDILYELDASFAVHPEGYEFHPRYKCHAWDGFTHFFKTANMMLPIGLVDELARFAKTHNHSLEFVDFERDPKPWLSREKFDSNCKQILAGSKYQVRDYQAEATFAALNNKKGILECCTSSGKSLMIYLFLRNLMMEKQFKHMLLIVPSIMLVTQMYEDFKDYGWTDINKWCELQDKDHVPTFNVPILITTWQSLKKEDVDFFMKQQAVVVDECHGARGVKISDYLKFCMRAEFKIGTTGTLPTSKCDQWTCKSVLGKTLYKITSKELIERGFLTKIIIANIFLQYPMDFILSNQERTFPEEVRMVEEYENRKTILNKILGAMPQNHNMLILCNHVDHVDDTVEYLKQIAPNRRITKITGSVKSAEREFIRVSAEESDGLIIVATFGTMSTGVNIKKIHEIVLYSNSKSKIKVLQSLGRGLRKHPEKSRIVIFDIVDDMRWKSKRGKVHSNYLYDHWVERAKYYQEQEFTQKSQLYPI